jgi:DNA-binding CsgD family transcriptional regulator
MPNPDPALLSSRDVHAAFRFICSMIDALGDADGFARRGVEQLQSLVAAELTTLSVCDLHSGHRNVTALPAGAIGAAERACFDRHFRSHPLVRYHAAERGRHAHRISDSVPFARFRQGELYADYYRRIGIDHALALPVHVDDGWLVSFVLNRRGRDFDERELALLDYVRAPLSALFRHSGVLEKARAISAQRDDALTAREQEVLHWVSAGKTDRDIADILGISHRTVHKHLQRVYTKLGVETRTAAAMRSLRLH